MDNRDKLTAEISQIMSAVIQPQRIWHYKSFVALLACTLFVVGLELGYDYGMDTMRGRLLGAVENGTAPARDVAYRPLPEIEVVYVGPEQGI